MTRKDYIKLADALHREKPGNNWNPNKLVQWELDVKPIADVLQGDNTRFDRPTFYAACNSGTGHEKESDNA